MTDEPIVPEPDEDEWSFLTKLAYEKEFLGMYVSGHPLAIVDEQLEPFRDAHMSDFESLKPTKKDEFYHIAGIVSDLDMKPSKAGKKMARFQLDDMTGIGRVTIFPAVFDQIKGKFGPDAVVKITARLEDSDFGRQFLAKDVEAFDIRELVETEEKKDKARVDVTAGGISAALIVPDDKSEEVSRQVQSAGLKAVVEDL